MVAAVTGFAIAASVLIAAPATAQTEVTTPGGVVHTAREISASPDGPMPADAVVVYWGFNDDGKYFQTQPLDASVPANRGVTSPDKTLPLDTEAQPTYANADGSPVAQSPTIQTLYCERFVSKVWLSGGLIQGDVDQRCTGQFINHWVDYRFERDSWRGWLGYSDWQASSSTSESRRVWRFGVGCGGPGDTGTYNYRLNTKGWARHVDGTQVGGGQVWGGESRYACGGGNGSN